MALFDKIRTFLRRSPKGEGELGCPENLRQQYRRDTEDEGNMNLTVRIAGGEYTGSLLDLSVGGAAARFGLAQDPGIQLGDMVEVVVSTTARNRNVTTPAEVVYSRQDGDATLRYGFRFTSIGNLYSQLDESFAGYFNRRAGVRVEPAQSFPLQVTVSYDCEELKATARDISISGLALPLSPKQAQLVCDAKELRVEVALPEISKRVQGVVTIRYRNKLPDGRVLHGLEFILNRPGGFDQGLDDIWAYIEKRNKRHWSGPYAGRQAS